MRRVARYLEYRRTRRHRAPCASEPASVKAEPDALRSPRDSSQDQLRAQGLEYSSTRRPRAPCASEPALRTEAEPDAHGAASEKCLLSLTKAASEELSGAAFARLRWCVSLDAQRLTALRYSSVAAGWAGPPLATVTIAVRMTRPPMRYPFWYTSFTVLSGTVGSGTWAMAW